MKKSSNALVLVLIFVSILIIFPISLFLLLKVQNLRETNNLKRKMISDIKSDILLFENVVEELSEYEKIYFTKEDSVIELLYYKNSEKQIITLSDHDEKFSQTTALFEKYKIYKILKNNNNVYFIYKTNLPFSFSLAYLIDENKRNEHEIKKIEKIFDNWYYIEEH